MSDSSGRVWAAYTELEEYHAGMWRRVAGDEERSAWLGKACALLRDIPAFEEAMRRALNAWPTSCAVRAAADDAAKRCASEWEPGNTGLPLFAGGIR